MNFSFPLHLDPPASSLHLTCLQHKVIRTSACRYQIRGGRCWTGRLAVKRRLTWPLAATRELERNLDSRGGGGVTFEPKCVTMTERQTRLPGRPPDLTPACAGATQQVLAKHAHPSSSPDNIYHQFQHLLLKTSQRPKKKCGITTRNPPLSPWLIYIPMSVHRLGFCLPGDHPADID